MFGWFKNRRRKKILAQPFADSWALHLNRNVRLTWDLPPDELKKLHQLTKVFVAEKHWDGCEGLDVTEEMKVTVAAQACLMLLGVSDFYFDNVKTILLYPQVFKREMSDGMSANSVSHRAGEAWQGGPIVLSWKDALKGGRNDDDGKNVVIHEFAHALDGLDGEMGGKLVFDDASDARRWPQIVAEEFKDLAWAKKRNVRTLLDHYGATNHAEFFAVASETFFEQPHELMQEHPELFSLLKKYFHCDPKDWQQSMVRRRNKKRRKTD
jgi:Mlc titration factor MtfA (ptsG expression regulator)